METFFKNMTAEVGTKEKFAQDLMVLIHDAEDLVKATGGNLAEKSKGELISALSKLKATCRRAEEHAIANSQRTAELIRHRPYTAVVLTFTVGLVIGALACRK